MNIQIFTAILLVFSVACGDNIKAVDSAPGVGRSPDYPAEDHEPEPPVGTWHETVPDAAPEMCEVLPWLPADECPDDFWECKRLAVQRCWELCE